MRRYIEKHAGIRIDKISVSRFPGLVFALGVVAMFMIGLPQLREVALLALAGGGILATLLYFWHNQTRW